MYTFLLVLLIINSVLLVAVILLQSGKGGGLAASFGGMSSSSDSLFGTRQAGNLLTKASWYGGGVFLFLAFVLSMMSMRTRQPRSVLDDAFAAPPAGGAPAAPNGAAPNAASPAIPLEPAPAPGGTSPAPQP